MGEKGEEKGKTMGISENIVVYDIKDGRYSYLNEYMNLYDIKGQGHLLTLVQGHSDLTFSNFFFLETAKPIEAKFQREPPWGRGTKICSNGHGHITNNKEFIDLRKTIWLRKCMSLTFQN